MYCTTESCILSENIMDYYIISQGKTTIPNVDDGEELLMTDVRFGKLGFFFLVENYVDFFGFFFRKFLGRCLHRKVEWTSYVEKQRVETKILHLPPAKIFVKKKIIFWKTFLEVQEKTFRVHEEQFLKISLYNCFYFLFCETYTHFLPPKPHTLGSLCKNYPW